MSTASSRRDEGPLSPHDEFLELCALSTSGELTEVDGRKLEGHLQVCLFCREALQQYEAVVSQAIPAIGAREGSGVLEPGPLLSLEQAEKALFERLDHEEKRGLKRLGNTSASSDFRHRILPVSSESTWRDIWMMYAAGVLLFLALGFFAYRVGIRGGGADIAKVVPTHASTQAPDQASLEEELSDAGHQREAAQAEIEQRDRMIADLRRKLDRQSGEISQMKAMRGQLESDLRAGDTSRQDLIQKRTDLAQELDATLANSHTLQERLDSLAQQSSRDSAFAKASEAKVNDLTHLLQEREAMVEQRDQLLDHDRDIRELMGARDLYIAEVYDVARTGETKKPYGRVFYTRGKSLIFYAYDLDLQRDARKANTFQVWGRRGSDRQQALNLGVFYEDDASKKRWILKFDDPSTLAQIDGVFVTVEPNGGSQKPSGKPLLFAYLNNNPNHP